MATRADAERIAALLKVTPRVYGAELFGSVLRAGKGHDLDLVLLVDEDVSHMWWREMAEELRVRMDTSLQPLRQCIKAFLPWLDEWSTRGRKERRIARASELLGVDLRALARGTPIDVFLMPVAWRTEQGLAIETLQNTIGLMSDRKTRMFLEAVAQRAVRL